jgi:uncharacterized protein (TIGR00251 family)
MLHVHLQPRASRDRLVGLHGSALKIALTAPPVDNAANASLLSFLAALLQFPRSSFSLYSGSRSREKQIHISTDTPAALTYRLEQLLSRVDKKNPDG